MKREKRGEGMESVAKERVGEGEGWRIEKGPSWKRIVRNRMMLIIPR